MSRLAPSGTRSLFWRLMIAFGSVICLTLLLGALIVSSLFQSLMERRVAEGMADDAHNVALWAASQMAAGGLPDDIRPYTRWLQGVSQGRLFVLNQHGVVIADTGPRPGYRGTRLDHPWVARLLSGDSLKETTPDPWLRSAITAGAPVLRQGEVIGAVLLFAGPPQIWDLAGNSLDVVLLTLAGAGLLSLLAASTITRELAAPISRMGLFANSLGQQRFADELKPYGIREYDELAQSLREAGDKLYRAFSHVATEKKRIDSLIHQMAEGVVATDEQGRIMLVNEAAGRLLGLPGPFSNQTPDEAGLPAELVAAFAELSGSAQPAHVRTCFTCAGAELQADVTSAGLEDQPFAGAVAVIQDVTREEQLKRLRENFVANVSHELRAPLASISAGLEAMHDSLIDEQARPRFLKAMLSEIGRLRRLTDDLLELSRLDAGMLEIPVEEFDLRPLCEGLIEKWEPRATAAGLRLEFQCAHVRVLANYDRVEEILSNLLDNAMRFTSEGRIKLHARREGEMVRISVSDTGAGIPREMLPHLWERFYKADPSRTRAKGGGTGLGLAIVKQLVERLGGEVAVRSVVGEGSTFSFTVVAAPTER